METSFALVQTFEFPCLFGRPVFYGMFQFRNAPEKARVQAVIELLKNNIMNRVVLPGSETKEAPLTAEHALAVLGSIASIKVSAGSEMMTHETGSYFGRERMCVHSGSF